MTKTSFPCSFQEYGSSKAAMKLSEFVRCPVKVQRCAGRVVQTELVVQIDQRDVVPGDIVIFEPGDLFPGDVRLLSTKHLVVRYSTSKAFCRKNKICELFYVILPICTDNFRLNDHSNMLLEQSVLVNRRVLDN